MIKVNKVSALLLTVALAATMICGCSSGGAPSAGADSSGNSTLSDSSNPEDTKQGSAPQTEDSEKDEESGDTADASATDEIKPELFSGSAVGDIVVFGSYEQDGDEANGKEPVEWEVLEVQNNLMLVVSRFVLDCIPYHMEDTDIGWDACSLRNWLNDDFYNSAFSADEKAYIQETTLSNAGNEYWPGGPDTNDKVFCLSMDEIIGHYNLKENAEKEGFYCDGLVADTTTYASNKNIIALEITQEKYDGYYKGMGYGEEIVGRNAAWWWVRSPGSLGCNVCIADQNGEIGWGFRHRILVNMSSIGVRPALWLNRTGAEGEVSGNRNSLDQNQLLSLYEEVKKKDAEIDLWFETEAMDMMSMRTKAGEKYALWDTFLNTVLGYFEATLPGDEWEALKAEQQTWSEMADAIAEEHASEYEGGTAYPLELSLSYTEEMIVRAEELMQRVD